MLKGKQKKLDKNKDGKISGEDFKMMKAKYGKMMKAEKGGGADMGKKDYKLGLKIQGDYKGKDLKGKAAAKRKFKVYPSAYANMYGSAVCSGKIKPGGKKKKTKKRK